jgi:hypothetical protein
MLPESHQNSARDGTGRKGLAVLHFASTHDPMLAERLATGRGYAAEVIPRPPGKIGRCGVALEVAAPDLDALTEIFKQGGLTGFEIAEG